MTDMFLYRVSIPKQHLFSALPALFMVMAVFRGPGINLSERTVRKRLDLIRFTSAEHALPVLYAKHAGKVLTNRPLLREICGPGYISQPQYLRVFIAQVRKKIENHPKRSECIITASGVDYRFIGKE